VCKKGSQQNGTKDGEGKCQKGNSCGLRHPEARAESLGEGGKPGETIAAVRWLWADRSVKEQPH